MPNVPYVVALVIGLLFVLPTIAMLLFGLVWLRKRQMKRNEERDKVLTLGLY